MADRTRGASSDPPAPSHFSSLADGHLEFIFQSAARTASAAITRYILRKVRATPTGAAESMDNGPIDPSKFRLVGNKWKDPIKRGSTKGQLISKQNCQARTSPKNRTKRTQDTIQFNLIQIQVCNFIFLSFLNF